MKKEKADRTVLTGVTSFVLIAVLLIGSIVAEIVSNISHIVPIVFAIYTIANALFWTTITNPKYKKSTMLLRYIIGFIVAELAFIIPYILILFIESII